MRHYSRFRKGHILYCDLVEPLGDILLLQKTGTTFTNLSHIVSPADMWQPSTWQCHWNISVISKIYLEVPFKKFDKPSLFNLTLLPKVSHFQCTTISGHPPSLPVTFSILINPRLPPYLLACRCFLPSHILLLLLTSPCLFSACCVHILSYSLIAGLLPIYTLSPCYTMSLYFVH